MAKSLKNWSVVFLLISCHWITSGRSFHLNGKSFSKTHIFECVNKKSSHTNDSGSKSLVLWPVDLDNFFTQLETIKSEKVKSRVMLVTVAALYGTNFGCVKLLDAALFPSIAAAMRFSLAALVFFPYLLKNAKLEPQLTIAGLEVGVYCSIGYWGQAQALLTSSASTVSFICSLAVIVVPILDILKKRGIDSSKKWWLPLYPALIASAGVGCLELGGSTLPGIGDLWALSQPMFFGLAFWRVEQHVKRMKGSAGEMQTFTAAMLVVVAAFCWVWVSHDFGLFYEGVDASQVAKKLHSQVSILSDWHVFAAILWTGIVTTALTIYGENIAMKHLSAVESTVIYSTEPLWGTAFAAIALGETVGWNTAIGAFLILAACLWSSLDGSPCLFPILERMPLSAFNLKVSTQETHIFRSDQILEASDVIDRLNP